MAEDLCLSQKDRTHNPYVGCSRVIFFWFAYSCLEMKTRSNSILHTINFHSIISFGWSGLKAQYPRPPWIRLTLSHRKGFVMICDEGKGISISEDSRGRKMLWFDRRDSSLMILFIIRQNNCTNLEFRHSDKYLFDINTKIVVCILKIHE